MSDVSSVQESKTTANRHGTSARAGWAMATPKAARADATPVSSLWTGRTMPMADVL